MPVNNVPKQNVVNRLSSLQRQILDVMRERRALPPVDGRLGHLPRTGQIVDALDRARTAANYASFSRALARMEKVGLVASYMADVLTPGKGRYYALTAAAVVSPDPGAA